MKKIKKFSIFLTAALIMSMLFSVCAFAAEASSDGLGQIKGEDLSIMERVEYALQGTVTGMLMVFAVLALLAIVVSLSKLVLYDLPRNARAAAAKEREAEEAENTPTVTEEPVTPTVVMSTEPDDGELIAVITAAVAAAIESGEYKEQFASGFRVVSFTRVSGAWDKK